MIDQLLVHNILIGEDDSKYSRLCDLLLESVGLQHISIDRIYLSHGRFSALSSAGESSTSKEVESFPITALGHPNLGRLTVGADILSNEIRQEIEFLCLLLSKQFQVDWMKNLMRVLSTPIRWDDDASIYLSELASVCRRAAAAAHIAIREEEGAVLRASAWDSNDRKVDFSSIRDIKATSGAGKIICPPREDDRVFYHGPDSDLVKFMREKLAYDHLSVIISMPVIVQGERLGAINFAYDHEYEFSLTFRTGLELLANVIGTALNNYRLRTTLETNARRIFWSGRQALNYELMQGYRHWAGSSLFELDTEIKHLVTLVEESSRAEDATEVEEELDRARDDLHSALQSMEDLTSSYKLDKKEMSLHSAFDMATKLLAYEIEKENVEVVNSNLPDSMVGNEDSLRAVFLNLILNSIQAFRDNKRKNGRITLSLSTEKDKVRFIYKDNGPGLRLGPKLRKPSDVWLPEVTTKPNGTGFGMPMVRQVIQNMHGGEISLNTKARQAGFSVSGFVARDGFKVGEWDKK